MDAPLIPSSSRPSAPLALTWAACGLLFSVGAWMAITPSHATDARIQVQPAAAWKAAGVIQPRSQRGPTSAAQPQAASSALAAAAPVFAEPFASSSQSSGIWLSVAALAMGAAAAAASVWHKAAAVAGPRCSCCKQGGHTWVTCPCPACAGTVGNWATASVMGDILQKQARKMDEVALTARQDLADAKNLTPAEVILDLQRGNARFWSGTPDRPEKDAMQRRAMIIGQAPVVSILSCADSRVPVEILFDQGLGRVFVVRVAGNILDDTAMGSIEFSVKYLGVKVVLVMGHEACGAVKGAMAMSEGDISAQPDNLQVVLRSIKENLNLAQLKRMRDIRSQDREAIVTNATSQVKKLMANPLIAERVANKSIMVAAAFYEITSGMVDFYSLDKNGLVSEL